MFLLRSALLHVNSFLMTAGYFTSSVSAADGFFFFFFLQNNQPEQLYDFWLYFSFGGGGRFFSSSTTSDLKTTVDSTSFLSAAIGITGIYILQKNLQR